MHSSRKKKKLSKKAKGILFGSLAVLSCAGIAFFLYQRNQKPGPDAAQTAERNTVTVQRGTVANEMTSSGTLSPKNTYTITSLVSGEITRADFEEGDEVKEGQVLYVLDSTDVARSIETAEKTLEQAREDLLDAQSDYEKACAKLADGRVTASQAGYIRDLKLSKGDTVSGNAQIGKIYNDNAMTVRMPFLSMEADALSVGQDISVMLGDTGEQIPGRITEKSGRMETLTGGVVVKYVTILVTNPGGLSETDTATAFTGEIWSAGDGYFEPYTEEDIRLDLPGNVTVEKVCVTEGSYVAEGTVLFTVTDDSREDALRSYKKSLSQAEQTLESAEERLSSLTESQEEYVIKSPVSGKVISKNAKAGDKVTQGGSSQSSLAVIYDLSALTFEMSIDELDISKISEGLSVEVTADAFEGETFRGTVTNVSLNGSAQSGVTTYPVVVTLSEKGNLLPGMNVNGTITLEKSENTLCIPSGALNRGNTVYVETASIGEDASIEKVESPLVPEGFTAVKVTTGIISDDMVEITGGLTEGMAVYSEEKSEESFQFDFRGGMNGGGMPGGNMPSGGAGGVRPSGGNGGERSRGGGMPGGF